MIGVLQPYGDLLGALGRAPARPVGNADKIGSQRGGVPEDALHLVQRGPHLGREEFTGDGGPPP